MTHLTLRQNEYLRELARGPKTTTDLMRIFEVSQSSAGRMTKLLREKGMVEARRLPGVRGNILLYSLTAPYNELVPNGFAIPDAHPTPPITDAEIMYAADLRNEGLLGQRLIEKYHQQFPERPSSSVQLTVIKARERHLCR